MAKAKAKAKTEDQEKAPRKSVWGEGETPNKTTLAKLMKEFKAGDEKQTLSALTRFAAENDLSAEALATMSSEILDKDLEPEEAARQRRAGLRAVNGAKVKRKPKAVEVEDDDDDEEEVVEKPAKRKGKKKKAA